MSSWDKFLFFSKTEKSYRKVAFCKFEIISILIFWNVSIEPIYKNKRFGNYAQTHLVDFPQVKLAHSVVKKIPVRMGYQDRITGKICLRWLYYSNSKPNLLFNRKFCLRHAFLTILLCLITEEGRLQAKMDIRISTI